jgi:hypothetical protein
MLTANLRHDAAQGAVKDASVVVKLDPAEITLSDDFVNFVKANPDVFGGKNLDAILEDVRGEYAVTQEGEPGGS